MFLQQTGCSWRCKHNTRLLGTSRPRAAGTQPSRGPCSRSWWRCLRGRSAVTLDRMMAQRKRSSTSAKSGNKSQISADDCAEYGLRIYCVNVILIRWPHGGSAKTQTVLSPQSRGRLLLRNFLFICRIPRLLQGTPPPHTFPEAPSFVPSPKSKRPLANLPPTLP